MTEYIERDSFLSCKRNQYCMNCERRKNSKGKIVYAIGDAQCRACGIGDVLDDVEDFPAADVVERDEGIRIGAELAAMHGSDATSEDLERAFWTGFEEAMKKRDVRPVVCGQWIDEPIKGIRYHCSVCQGRFDYTWRYCPNCGADMREES